LVLRRPDTDRTSAAPRSAVTDFTRLFAPRAVAVAGASSRGGGFGNRALAAYRAFGWDEHLFALHPTATAVDGVPAVANLAELGEPVDYLLVAVAAEQCAPLVLATSGRVPFVHVISGGFEEVGPTGRARGRELLDAARAVGTRLNGPNCIGVYCPAGRQTFQLHAPRDAGSVSVVSQSGGLAGDIVIGGAARGLQFSKVLSAGNAIDVAPAEVADWLLHDPDTAVIGLYLEGSSGAAGLVDVLRQARGVKPVVLLVGGQSDQGAAAVVSHTGSLTPAPRLWDALETSTSCGQ
jgi:acyl-CoA synthetase (NDP forming)